MVVYEYSVACRLFDFFNSLPRLQITYERYIANAFAFPNNQIDSNNLCSVYLGDQVLNCKPFYKYLGVYLDESLSFKEQVTRLVNKVSRQLGLLSRVRNSLTAHAAERVFATMILPKLDYCNFVWNNLAPSRYKTLERLQTRAARIVLKEICLSHDQLLRQLGWMSLKTGSTMHISTFVFKCVNNIAPEMFKEYFVKLSHNYFTRRNGLDLLVPIVHTESAKKGCFYSGAQAFNNLPPNLKELESLLMFKTKLKDFAMQLTCDFTFDTSSMHLLSYSFYLIKYIVIVLRAFIIILLSSVSQGTY